LAISTNHFFFGSTTLSVFAHELLEVFILSIEKVCTQKITPTHVQMVSIPEASALGVVNIIPSDGCSDGFELTNIDHPRLKTMLPKHL
jgi:hypothetical protein